MATEEQMTQIRRAAYNDETRAIARDGVRLTWGQADELGDAAMDWMRARLGLESETDAEGVVFYPASPSGAAATLGRKGGASRTAAKVAAARANGRKGGRPKKVTP